MKRLNKNRGQSLVEYALILFISIITATVINEGKVFVEDYLAAVTERERDHNGFNIITPTVPDPDIIWDNSFDSTDRTDPLKPVAFFSVSNPVYANEPVTYWDGSYDPDGIIVDRKWEGKQNVFNRPGEYLVTLTVWDDSDLTDSYSETIKVIERGEYTKLINDHKNEERTELSRSPIYNVGGKEKRIIDHIHGKRKDLYGVEHLVIEKNLWKHTQDRAQDVTYEVKIPILEVTYNGDGTVKSSRPYTVNGVPQYTTQVEKQTIPITGDINAGNESNTSTEPVDNKWTFYVYEELSSVRNSTGGKGERSPGADYQRFAPEKELTRQDPEFESSRDSQKSGANSPGYDAKSTPCKTCTVANQFNRGSEYQTKKEYNSCNVSGSSEGQSFSLSPTPSSPTFSRTYNWIDHEAYDNIYKYQGVGFSNGTQTKIKLTRATWKTEGWKDEEMRGVGSTASARPKYTECEGDGWSSSCWKPISASGSSTSGWSAYDSDRGTNTRECDDCWDGSSRSDRTCSWSYTDYVRATATCSWLGKEVTSDSMSFSTERRGTTSCTPDSCSSCPPEPPPPPPPPPPPAS